MRITKRIAIISFAGFFATALVLGSSFITRQTASPLDHEEQVLRQELTLATTSKEANRLLSGLNRIDEDRNALQRWAEMSPIEQQSIVDAMRFEAEQAMNASATEEEANTSGQPGPFLGIFDGDKVPAPFRGSEFRVVNYWGGEFDGQPASAYAGYRPEKPAQGVLAVAIGEGVYRYDFFAIPSSSGPLRITEVDDGEIRLVSVGGIFMKESSSGEQASVPVRIKGGEEYTFDLQARRFK